MLSTETKSYYRRNLPHWHPPGAAIFLTYRLHGSLPDVVVQQLRDTQSLLAREIDLAERADKQIAELKLKRHKKLFAKIDTVLDKAEFGPRWLGQNEIAQLVEDALLRRYAELYKLWAYVVMVNHVHLLLRAKPQDSPRQGASDPLQPISSITKRIKGYTAREANLILGRTGEPFWQEESFDHWPRDESEFFRIVAYIENNPVKAGLVKRPEEWQWSSAAERKRRGWSEIQSLK